LLRKSALQQQRRDNVVIRPPLPAQGCHANRAFRQAWPQATPTPSAARANTQVTTSIQTRLSGIAARLVAITKYAPEPVGVRTGNVDAAMPPAGCATA
jgi:hypothetical protein